MNRDPLHVRELRSFDIPNICDYWLRADPEFLQNMGVDLKKLPTEQQLSTMLTQAIELPYEEKPSYATIWCVDGKAVGHCNETDIQFGKEALMHLHMWKGTTRRKGMGAALLKRSVPFFFTHLQLKQLISEPYVLNEAPNRTLPKAGFVFEKEYVTTPGSLSFEQGVKRWVLKRPVSA